MTIRPYEIEDAADCVEMANEDDTTGLTTVEDFLHRDKTRSKELFFQRFVVAEGGRTVGFASVFNGDWSASPDSYYTRALVRKSDRSRGYGRALADQVEAVLAERKAQEVRTFLKEHDERSVRFAERRGFAVEQRVTRSQIELEQFDPNEFAEWLGYADKAGVRIMTYAELAHDPDRARKAHAMHDAGMMDVPTGDAVAEVPFDRYKKTVLGSPHFDERTLFLAVDPDGDYVGYTQLWGSNLPAKMHTGLTAVARSHRGKGLAKALKVAALAHAKSIGIKIVDTENDETNARMLAVNWKLGFQAFETDLFMVKKGEI
ncbi:MAG: GNAT family N-acetyltransferase [Armatimonadetes bacterium]|nr:GNAT family N-acetyltransferase [Armatimonadota bacterium]